MKFHIVLHCKWLVCSMHCFQLSPVFFPLILTVNMVSNAPRTNKKTLPSKASQYNAHIISELCNMLALASEGL